MTDYNDGMWRGWNGGECPVHPQTIVEISTRMGAQEAATASAWTWHNSANPIIAFRVIKQHREPRELWVQTSAFGERVYQSQVPGSTLFREVLE